MKPITTLIESRLIPFTTLYKYVMCDLLYKLGPGPEVHICFIL
jgi:hypothetical protein